MGNGLELSVRGTLLLACAACLERDACSRRSRLAGSPPVKEAPTYAAIRQGKAKSGMAEELARRIKEGAIPIISDVKGRADSP